MKQIKFFILAIAILSMVMGCNNPMDVSIDLPSEEKGAPLSIEEMNVPAQGTKGSNPTKLYDTEYIATFSNNSGDYVDVASSNSDFYFLSGSGGMQKRPHSNILNITQSKSTYSSTNGKLIHIDYTDSTYGVMGITDQGYVYSNIMGSMQSRGPAITLRDVRSFTTRVVNGDLKVIIVDSYYFSGDTYPTYTGREFKYEPHFGRFSEINTRTFGLYEGKAMAATSSYIYGYDGGGYYNDGNFWRRTALNGSATTEVKGYNSNHSYDSSTKSGEYAIECDSIEYCNYQGTNGFIIYNKFSTSMEIAFLPTARVNYSAYYKGIPRYYFSGSKYQESYHKFWVRGDVDQITFNMFGYSGTSTGDPDIYVRYNLMPTMNDWDYRPYIGGYNETVTINNPNEGWYYIMVRGYSAFTNVQLGVSIQN